MTGPPNKRQKREEYRKAQQNADASQGKVELPKKKFYRQRAHANPFSDHALTYPASPSEMDWSSHFPAYVQIAGEMGNSKLNRRVEVADIGCGFGGLLVALSPVLPDTLMVGMELRTQVLDYVNNRISALRAQNQIPPPPNSPPAPQPSLYQNISALRSNTMKFLPNYFSRSQLTHIFLCFPDPHFKQRKHKARIVSAQLNAEYAYVVRPGGKVYTITDVEELHQWMVKHFEGSEAGDITELWERLGQEELDGDECVKIMSEETEEGKKVSRNGGKKFIAVWKRKEDPEWPV